MNRRLDPIFWLTVILTLSGCGTDVSVTETRLEPIILFDRDGRQWDVTQSVHRYEFEPGKFQFGLGAFAIQPIFPTMVGIGEKGFPSPADTFELTGLFLEGEPRAYGTSKLLGFEVADDVVSSRAIAVVVQPILRTTAAYVRTTDDVTLTLSASGWAYQNRTILFDLQTGSMWYRLPGTSGLTCINGPFFGNVLEEIATARDTWDHWFALHPNTRVLVIPPTP